MNFIKDKFQIQHLERNNPYATTQAVADWQRSSSVEKD